MTTTSKRSLISESVATIQIGVHPIGPKHENTLHAWSRGLHMQQPFARSLLDQNWASAPGMKSWFLAIIQPDRHPRLPHFPSIEPP
jgi:hypothetical protein